MGKWFIHAATDIGSSNYPEEVDFTVWGTDGKILEGGIDSYLTGRFTYRGLQAKANHLHQSWSSKRLFSHVVVSDRETGELIYTSTPWEPRTPKRINLKPNKINYFKSEEAVREELHQASMQWIEKYHQEQQQKAKDRMRWEEGSHIREEIRRNR